MKKATVFLLSIWLMACNSHKKETSAGTTTPATGAKDSLTWIDQFREFRNAVYAHNKTKAKQFFSFPIMNENNEIWYVARPGMELSPDTIKPFTEQDFDRYFDQLFSKEFITVLLKVKSEELYKKDSTETATLEMHDHSTYKIFANYDTRERSLVLNLFSNVVPDDKEDAPDAGGEFSVIYFFTVSADNHLKFKQIRVAG